MNGRRSLRKIGFEESSDVKRSLLLVALSVGTITVRSTRRFIFTLAVELAR
jgi:hypothetical protein